MHTVYVMCAGGQIVKHCVVCTFYSLMDTLWASTPTGFSHLASLPTHPGVTLGLWAGCSAEDYAAVWYGIDMHRASHVSFSYVGFERQKQC